MIEILAVIILIGIVAGAVTYIVKQKKKGVHCIGCPYAGNCKEHHGGQECH